MRSSTASLLTTATLAGLSLVQAQSYPNCPQPSWTCNSYGVDYQEGYTYFQDSNLNENFTFLTQFTRTLPDYCTSTLSYTDHHSRVSR